MVNHFSTIKFENKILCIDFIEFKNFKLVSLILVGYQNWRNLIATQSSKSWGLVLLRTLQSKIDQVIVILVHEYKLFHGLSSEYLLNTKSDNV